MSTKTAVGYIRVSTISQAEKGQSLITQEEAIKEYCKKEDIELIEIYRDEGISGGSVENRPGLLRLLDNINGVNFVVIHRLSRLGRNVRELLTNVHYFEKEDVELVFTKDKIDLSNPQGRLMLGLLASIAEFERDITREASLENKIARCKAGIPATGKFPFGRKFNKETNEWYFDPPDIKEVFQDITNRYLAGGSLKEIASTVPKKYKLGYSNILKVFKGPAGDTWEVKFKDQPDPIVYNIPPLLDKETIAKVHERLKFNYIWTRSDIRKKEKYVISGFLRCWACKKALSGQVQKYKETKHKYYVHPGGKYEKCRALSSIKAERIEEAVFQAIFENTYDEDSFNAAIEESMPDPKKRIDLKQKIDSNESQLQKINKQQAQLLELLLDGKLDKKILEKKDAELSKQKAHLTTTLKKQKVQLKNMPSRSEYENQGERLRLILLDHFGSQEHFKKMTFEQKRKLLHAVFQGTDEDGIPYGVYLEKKGYQIYEYFIYARLFSGSRILRPDSFDGNAPDAKNGFVNPYRSTTKTSQPSNNKSNNNYKTKTRSLYHRGHM